MIRTNGVELCTESFGKSHDTPIILIMGATASMIWWDSDFCQQLSQQGFYVIRYDNRDVGQSTTYAPGEPPYSVLDMANDLLGVMDAYKLKSAHLVGMSLGGMIAQLVAIQYPKRVETLTLISTSVWDDIPELPQIDPKVLEYHASAASLNWESRSEVIDYMVGGWRILNGSRHPFDEKRITLLAETEFARANNLLSMFNHSLLKGGEEFYGKSQAIKASTLIIHGSEDPVLPFAHALEICKTIPHSKLVEIRDGGHQIHPMDYDLVVDTIVHHVRPE